MIKIDTIEKKLAGGSTTGTSSFSFPNDIGNILKYPDTFMIKIFENIKSKSTSSSSSVTTSSDPYSSIASESPRFSESGSSAISGQTGLYKKAYSEYILLPMPNELSYSQAADWSQEDVGIGGIAAQKLFNQGQYLEGSIDSLKSQLIKAGESVKSGLVGFVSGVSGEALMKLNSRIQNAYSEVLFNGQQHRQFTFSWKFLPENNNESENVKNIIKLLRGQSAPDMKTGGFAWIQSPSLFECILLHSGNENTNIPKMSTMALTNIDVNYFSAGESAFFHNGHPVSIDMNLTFMEMEILHKHRILEDGY